MAKLAGMGKKIFTTAMAIGNRTVIRWRTLTSESIPVTTELSIHPRF
jgi:hypothetical protein